MHLMKLMMSHGLDAPSVVETEENGGFENVKSALLTSSPSGVIGDVKGWTGANSNSVLKQHQQSSSYRTSRKSSSSRFADNNKLLSIFTVIGLVLIFSNFSKMSGVAAMPRCPPQGADTAVPVDCSFGTSKDYCGRTVCAKGPGQICGVGLFKLLGSCGDGLYCNCGRCTGCSLLTMECYDKTCM